MQQATYICTLGILKPEDRIIGSHAKLSTAIVTQTSYGLAANTVVLINTLKHANHRYFSGFGIYTIGH